MESINGPIFTKTLDVVLLVSITAIEFLLAAIVYLRNRESDTHKAFSAMTIAIITWSIGLFLLNHLRSNALLWTRVVFANTFLTGFILVYFSQSFPKRTSSFRGTPRTIFVLLAALLALVSVLTNAIVRTVEPRAWGTNIVAGTLYPLFVVYMLICVGVTLVSLFRKYRSSHGLARAQLKYLFMGFSLSALVALNTNMIVPLFTGTNEMAQIGPYSMIILMGFTAYAIIRHRLMDIRALVFRSFTYGMLLIILGSLFVGLIAYVKQGYETVVNPDTLFIIGGLLAAFGFQPLRRTVQRYTDRIFFKRRYDPEKLLSRLGDILSSKIELDDLTESVLRVLTKEMRLARAVFVLASNLHISEIKAIGYGNEVPTKLAWRRAIHIGQRKRTIVVADELEEGSEERETLRDLKTEVLVPLMVGHEKKKIIVADELEEGTEEREILRSLEAEVLVPLTAEDKFVGLLALGEKLSGDMFASQDLRILELLAPEAAIAIENAMLFKEKEKRIQELSALHNIALSLGSTLDLHTLLEQVIDAAIRVTDAETGSIMLVDEDSQTLAIKVSRGIHPDIHKTTRIKIGDGIAGWVAQTSEPLVLINGQDPRFQEHLRRDEIISSLTVPLKVREKVIGVLSVNRKDKKEIFTQNNLRIITSFAAQAAEAIENARLYENLQQTFLETISALAAAVDAKDHYTYGHSEMVTDLSVATARELMLPAEEVRKIEIASKLHDIGKIGIDGAILNKPGRLTEEERRIIEEHPKIAVDILKSVDSLKEIIPLILYHHERFDGKGYLVGLSGNAIPLGARILATADSFNAMVSDRPYRPALDLFTATMELQDNSGTQFDPQVVEAFLRVLERKYVKDSEMLVTRTE